MGSSRRPRQNPQHLSASTFLLFLLQHTSCNAFIISSPRPTTKVGDPTNKSQVRWLDFDENAPHSITRGCGVPLLAGGFGASTGSGTNRNIEAPGVAEAKQALKNSGGDLNRATSLVFQQRLKERGRNDVELGSMLEELSVTGRSTAPVENETLHEAIVSATWDAVAVMNALPKSRKTGQEEREEKRIVKRLKQVADAARLPPVSPTLSATAVEPYAAKVLDIGCGDGTLMPYLLGDAKGTSAAGKKVKKQKKAKKKGEGGVDGALQQEQQQHHSEAQTGGPVSTVAAEDVTGVDLSEVMIESARLKYEDAKWVTGNLFSLDTLLGLDGPRPLFSTAVFSGSLQFFKDPVKALSEASAWLLNGGHVIITHVQGSDFVADECRRNPRVAPSSMPGREGMEAWAGQAGLTLLDGADDGSQRDFLLRVMRKN